MIKFLDIYKQDRKLHKKILNKINILFKKNDFILGNEVNVFEKILVNFVAPSIPSVAQMELMH